MAVIVIARLMLQEAMRRRLLLALALLTIAVIALTGWGFSRIPTIVENGQPLPEVEARFIASQLLILVMFMFSNILALSAVFVASPAISADVESGVALSMLSRPISRRDYVLGKWLGLAILVAVYAVAAASLEIAVVNWVISYLPPRPVEFVAYVLAEGLVLLTLALFLSTRISGMVGGVIALVLFGVAWLAGIVGGIGAAFGNSTIEGVGTISKLLLPTDGLWRGAVYSLQPAAMTAVANAQGPTSSANPFFAATAPPAIYLVWCAAWVVGMLGLAIWSFSKREL